MNKQEIDDDYYYVGLITLALQALAFLISPILFIWALNVLFNLGIPLEFKTWLAGMILILLARFHIKAVLPYQNEDDQDYEYDEKTDPFEDETPTIKQR